MAEFHAENERMCSVLPFTLAVHIYGSDATTSIYNKSSLIALKLKSIYIDPGMLAADPSIDFKSACNIREAWADIQMSAPKGTVAGAKIYGSNVKQLQSLGCPLVASMANISETMAGVAGSAADVGRTLRIEIVPADGGGDQLAYRRQRRVCPAVRRSPYHLMIGLDCHFHLYHNIFKDGMAACNRWLEFNKVGWKYFGTLAMLFHLLSLIHI